MGVELTDNSKLSTKTNMPSSNLLPPTRLEASSDSESCKSEPLDSPTITCILNKHQNIVWPSILEYWKFIKEKDESKLDMFKIFQKYGHHGYIRIINYFRLNVENLDGQFPSNVELEKLYDEELSKDLKYLKSCLDADDFIIYSGDLEDEKEQEDKNAEDDVPELEETEKIVGSNKND